MYGLKRAGKDQVSFGPVPVLMVVKIIRSTVLVSVAGQAVHSDIKD